MAFVTHESIVFSYGISNDYFDFDISCYFLSNIKVDGRISNFNVFVTSRILFST